MNYIGSKIKLSNFIISTIKEKVGNLDNKIFCEPFAGTGIISRILKNQVKKLVVNDMEYYSYILNRNYIGNNQSLDYLSLFDYLENTPIKQKSIISQEYSENGIAGRLYFSEENGIKIDTIRTNLANLFQRNEITEDLYYFCLASLLESADKYANTASVYGAYLKKLKKSAQHLMKLEPALFDISDTESEIYNLDCNELIRNISGDILYLDPPYNARQYGANYHLLNTIAKYDNFIPNGKTGLREYKRSKYCKKSEVFQALYDLIKNANFKYIFISYNNEGLLALEQIQQICKHFGRYECVEKSYQRFKADANRKYINDKTIEYLHILEKE